MNTQKNTLYSRIIISSLLESDILSVAQLAEKTGLSEKTVRTKIDTINVFLTDNRLGQIRRKTRVGVWLDADDQQKQRLIGYFINEKEAIEKDQSSDSARFSQALRSILANRNDTPLTLKALSEKLYLSVPTTQKIIDSCREWLSMYNIDLQVIRNRGISLSGPDYSFRLAIRDYILRFSPSEELSEVISSFLPGLDQETIRRIIIDTEKEWSFEFAEESFNEIFILLCMTVSNSLLGRNEDLGLSDQEISMLEQYNEYNFASALSKKLSDAFDISVTKPEIAFLSVQILCSKLIDSTNYQGDARQILERYDNILTDFVHKIINVVSDVLNVDLTKDETLYKGLLVHIRPAIFRLRYNRGNENQLTSYLKSEYQQTFRVSWIVSVLFEEYFNLTITEDELGFIVLYIQAALDRNKAPINAVLVSKNGMGINQILTDKIRRNFPQISLNKIYSPHEFSHSEIDEDTLVITTVHLEQENANAVEIDELLSKISVDRLSEAVSRRIRNDGSETVRFDTACHSFFEPDLIFPHVHADSKEELIRHMTDRLVQKGYVTSRYYDTVMARENTTPTSIGNGIAVPHGDQTQINETRIVIATLDAPIHWDTDDCDIIFMLVVRMDNEYEAAKTQLFYKQFVKLIEDSGRVSQLRNFDKNTDFYKYLIQ